MKYLIALKFYIKIVELIYLRRIFNLVAGLVKKIVCNELLSEVTILEVTLTVT